MLCKARNLYKFFRIFFISCFRGLKLKQLKGKKRKKTADRTGPKPAQPAADSARVLAPFLFFVFSFFSFFPFLTGGPLTSSLTSGRRDLHEHVLERNQSLQIRPILCDSRTPPSPIKTQHPSLVRSFPKNPETLAATELRNYLAGKAPVST
jgi:hypothetical protein